jgi:hypothetical protein
MERLELHMVVVAVVLYLAEQLQELALFHERAALERMA